MGMKKFKMLNIICASCELSSKEKLVAQYFVYKSNKSGSCYPAVETIAKQCGVSVRTIQRATKKLQEKGFITIEKRYVNGKQTSNKYNFNLLLIEEMEREKEILLEEKSKKDEEVNINEISLEEILNEGEVNQEYLKHINVNLDDIVNHSVDMWYKNMDNELEEDSYENVNEEYDYDLLDYQLTAIKDIMDETDNKEIKDRTDENVDIDTQDIIESYKIQDNTELGNQEEKDYQKDNKDTVNKFKIQSRLGNKYVHAKFKERREFYAWRNIYMKRFDKNISMGKREKKKLVIKQGSKDYKICMNVIVGIKKIQSRKKLKKYLHNKKENIKEIILDSKTSNDFWKSYIKYGDIEGLVKN